MRRAFWCGPHWPPLSRNPSREHHVVHLRSLGSNLGCCAPRMLTSVEGMWSAQGLSCSTVMLTYIVLQFLLWAVHDGLQQLMFEQPGYAPFGTTMALFLQTTCVLGSLLEGAVSSIMPATTDATAAAAQTKAPKPRSSEGACTHSKRTHVGLVYLLRQRCRTPRGRLLSLTRRVKS